MLGNGVVRHGLLQGLGDAMRRLASVAVVEFPPPVLQEGLLGRQRLAIIGNIVTVATESIHGVHGVALCFGQKEKSIVKILRVLSRDLSTVCICLLCVCVHAMLLVLPPAPWAYLPRRPGCAASCGAHVTSGAVMYCRKSCPLTQPCVQELQDVVMVLTLMAPRLFRHDIFPYRPQDRQELILLFFWYPELELI